MKFDILIAGVGGQGTVLASRLLAAAAIEAGFFTRTSETIGMSQRGGCVVSHVRIGSLEASPIIPNGCADLLIGFELAEAARNLGKLTSKGKCIVNSQVIKPVTVSLGGASYDISEINEYLKSAANAVFVDGYSLAEAAGSIKAVNVVLLGAACAAGFLPFSKEEFLEVITKNIPKKLLEINLKAFNLGYEYIK